MGELSSTLSAAQQPREKKLRLIEVDNEFHDVDDLLKFPSFVEFYEKFKKEKRQQQKGELVDEKHDIHIVPLKHVKKPRG